VTFRHFLKQTLRPLPGFAGMFQRREQLREQGRAIELLRARVQERDTEIAALRAENEKQNGLRVQAEAALAQATSDREQAEEAKWQAIRQREQAEEARWQAEREREQADESKVEAIRERDQLASMRVEAEAAKHLQWKDVPQLEKQGLFVVGQTRSGTTVLTRALNTCPDIMLLSEANIYIEGMRAGFARWFNETHRQLGGSNTKGTYCPIAPDENANGPETFQWLGQRFRYVGDKIAFRGGKLGYDADECFGFHARHFFSSHYVCVVRNPADVMKSNKEMFKPEDLLLYADSYLQALLLILAFTETLPNAYVLFHESINQRTFDIIGERLGVDLSGTYEANYHKPYQAVESRGTDHAALPWLDILLKAHGMMREAFSPETLREVPNHPSWMMLAPWIRDLREELSASFERPAAAE
jgi:hypothetical protein